MGWGSVLAGIAGGVGGFFLGGPAGAVALGSQAYQAANAVGAEKEATKQQTQAADKSAALYAPYTSTGAQSQAALNTLMGFGGGSGTSLSSMAGTEPISARSRPADAPIVGHAAPRTSPELMDRRSTLASLGPQSSYAPTVRLMAPDGSTEDVPEQEAESFIKAGARRMS